MHPFSAILHIVNDESVFVPVARHMDILIVTRLESFDHSRNFCSIFIRFDAVLFVIMGAEFQADYARYSVFVG